jgi:predicted metal-binding protein
MLAAMLLRSFSCLYDSIHCRPVSASNGYHLYFLLLPGSFSLCLQSTHQFFICQHVNAGNDAIPVDMPRDADDDDVSLRPILHFCNRTV